MHYSFSLKVVGLVVGLFVAASHALALARPEETRRWLAGFPRSRQAGVLILSIDFAWALWLVYAMDWGEFYYLRMPMLVALPIFFYLTLRFVDEFLAARALGILALLVAAPLLDAAFLQPQVSRLFVVVLAYCWIIMGMSWISQPHLLRDQIGWASVNSSRWALSTGVGVVYGLAMLFCALVFY